MLELDAELLISTFERRGWSEPAPTPLFDPDSVSVDLARIGLRLSDYEPQE